MQYRKLNGTSLKVSALCLGTMMFGGQTSEENSLAIMDFAYDSGMNFWDTANAYNQGESERIVGKGLRGRRDDIILATKVFNQMGSGMNDHGLSRRNILSAADASLQRLGTDYIDIYYLHSPDYDTDIEETMSTMNDLVHAGKVRYIGVSNYAAWQIADILAVCDKRGWAKPIITQNVYNAITRGIESELIPFLKAHGLGLAVYNPIAAGLLAGKHKRGTPAENTRFSNNPGYYDRYWSDENFDAVDKLTEIAAAHGLSILQLAMKWVAERDCVTSVITGVSRLEQLQQNVTTLDGDPLDADTLAACDEVYHALAGTRFAYNR